MSGNKLRVNINSQAVHKLASLVANGVILSANVFLLGTSVHSQIRDRKRDRTIEGLQLTAEIAGAAAGLTKVIIETIDHGKTDNSI